MVGHHPTNKLIGREPIPNRKTFHQHTMRRPVISGIRPSFPGLSQSQGQVAHVLLTRSPLEYPRRGLSARLACVKHAASVRPEPGSNSPLRSKRPTRGRTPAGQTSKKIPAPRSRKIALPQRNPHHPPKRRMATGRPGRNTTEPIKALAFNTLLSSQETDTHRAGSPLPQAPAPGQPF